MAKKKRDEGSAYNWMDTYGDMVTLLLTFFVMLFSMSSVNEEKWEMLLRAFTAKGNETQQLVLSPEGEGDDIATNQGEASKDPAEVDLESLPTSFDELFEFIKAYVEQNNMEGTVTVEKSGDNSIYIRFQDYIFFEPDRAVLLPGSIDILSFMGNCLKAVEDQVLMTRVNGHTADPGIDNYSVSDRELSSDRANSVIEYFENISKVDSKKLMSQGYGKNFPIAENTTAEGRQRNRRVEMLILSNEILSGSQDELNQLLESLVTADFFNDQTNTQSMLIPPSIAINDATTDDLPNTSPESAPPAEPAAPESTGEPGGTLIPPPQSTGQEIPMQ